MDGWPVGRLAGWSAGRSGGWLVGRAGGWPVSRSDSRFIARIKPHCGPSCKLRLARLSRLGECGNKINIKIQYQINLSPLRHLTQFTIKPFSYRGQI
jgi:hypothetical protein